MNHQTEELIKKAVECIDDEGVFSQDQITRLKEMIKFIEKAIDKESSCNVSLSCV